MTEDDRSDGDEHGSGLRANSRAAVLCPGTRVVHTTDLGKEYEFTVADVDATWITFETGQQVHRDRFEREDFAVVSTGDAEGTVRATPGFGDARSPDGESGEAATPATDGGDLPQPNAD